MRRPRTRSPLLLLRAARSRPSRLRHSPAALFAAAACDRPILAPPPLLQPPLLLLPPPLLPLLGLLLHVEGRHG
jgi:hypothetical protein